MYELSSCNVPGWLHDYLIIRTLPNGVVERCRKCGDIQYFRNDVPNHVYLAFHARSALTKLHPRFTKEYANK